MLVILWGFDLVVACFFVGAAGVGWCDYRLLVNFRMFAIVAASG